MEALEQHEDETSAVTVGSRRSRDGGRRHAWQTDAACVEYPPEWWFPEQYDHGNLAEARAVCARCLVRRECLADALAQTRTPPGLWGGLSERQRRVLRRTAAKHATGSVRADPTM